MLVRAPLVHALVLPALCPREPVVSVGLLQPLSYRWDRQELGLVLDLAGLVLVRHREPGHVALPDVLRVLLLVLRRLSALRLVRLGLVRGTLEVDGRHLQLLLEGHLLSLDRFLLLGVVLSQDFFVQRLADRTLVKLLLFLRLELARL